jgi:hypothetical protein
MVVAEEEDDGWLWCIFDVVACGEQGITTRGGDDAQATWWLDRQHLVTMLSALGATTSIGAEQQRRARRDAKEMGKISSPR